jgi:hypothetical protein
MCDISVNSEAKNSQILIYFRYYPSFNLKIGDSSGYKKSGYNISHPTKIIIHGFQSSIKEDIFIVNKNGTYLH